MSIFKITGPHGSIYVVADEVNLQALLFDQYAVEVDGVELQDFYSVKRIADYKGEKLDGKKKTRRSHKKT